MYTYIHIFVNNCLLGSASPICCSWNLQTIFAKHFTLQVSNKTVFVFYAKNKGILLKKQTWKSSECTWQAAALPWTSMLWSSPCRKWKMKADEGRRWRKQSFTELGNRASNCFTNAWHTRFCKWTSRTSKAELSSCERRELKCKKLSKATEVYITRGSWLVLVHTTLAGNHHFLGGTPY